MEFANIQIEKIRNIEYYFQATIYSLIVFLVPFLMGHPQYAVGIIVNTALVLSALYLDFKGALPVIILPCLGVLSRGLIFGPFTVFLMYMIPFIWIGNAILVFSMKYFHLKNKMKYAPSLAIGSILKTVFLFLSAFMMVNLNVVPKVFMTSMGWMQLVTAIAGGIVAFGLVKARKMCMAKGNRN